EKVQEVLLEVRADDVSTSLREARVVKLLEEWRKPRRNDGIEYHLGATGYDLVDRRSIVGVLEGKVLLPDDRAAVGCGHFTQLLVHRPRPDIVGRRAVKRLRRGFLHQPGNERFNLLRRHRAGTEDERVTFLSLVLLRVDVQLFAIHYSGALDSLPR